MLQLSHSINHYVNNVTQILVTSDTFAWSLFVGGKQGLLYLVFPIFSIEERSHAKTNTNSGTTGHLMMTSLIFTLVKLPVRTLNGPYSMSYILPIDICRKYFLMSKNTCYVNMFYPITNGFKISVFVPNHPGCAEHLFINLFIPLAAKNVLINFFIFFKQ